MTVTALSILLSAILMATTFPSDEAPSINSKVTDASFTVSATKSTKTHTGFSFKPTAKSNKHLKDDRQTSLAPVKGIPIVPDAGAEAVFQYSRGCFAPDDQQFECIYDVDSENPQDPDDAREDSPAGMSPAEFNTIMATEFARLHVTGSGLNFQPQNNGIIGIDFILVTSPEPQLHHTELFDIPLTIRATPVHYQWDMGDGTIITTTDPGQPHPNPTVTHLYEEPGTYTITLTTTWTGHFTIDQDPTTTWYPIAGTITTTQTSHPITHKKYQTVLINPEN